jgi:hypothetical protein
LGCIEFTSTLTAVLLITRNSTVKAEAAVISCLYHGSTLAADVVKEGSDRKFNQSEPGMAT